MAEDNLTKKAKKPIFAAMREVFFAMCKKDVILIPASNSNLQQVMSWGKLDRPSACLFSFFAVQSVNTSNNWWQFDDLQNYLDLETSDYAEFIPTMDNLILRGFFALRYDQPHVKGTFAKDTYFRLPEELEQIICYNRKFKPYKPLRTENFQNNCMAFLYRASQEGFNTGKFYYENLINGLYKDDPVLSIFTKDTLDWYDIMSPLEALNFFTRVGLVLVKGETSVSLKSALEDIRDGDPEFIVKTLKAFKEEKSFFLKKDIFRIDKSNFGDDISLIWGDWAKENIFQGDYELLLNTTKVKELGVINNKDIKPKDLFYNEENQKDIERLDGLLEDETYQKMRKRLEEKNMPKGLIILMYGPPGTGKTETVMQLARKTGRDLFHVNIQEVRSCWVGESEKNTKSIFDSYKNSKKEKKPILLFNEADGVISKRSSLTGDRNSSVDKMENAMQNIILEEFENFDGICILTSNMAESNLDAAFDRRILFKLKLENPKKDVKKKIWKNRMENLSDSDLEKLSEYDFSGGQIENIRRKVVLDEVLYGKEPTIETIEDFCKKEKLIKDGNGHTIGFNTK